MATFAALGLSKESLAVLALKGFEVPTPIQEMAIPVILNGTCDVVAQAQTGTGKTAAFGLPLVETLDGGSGKVQAIVLAPTRELAVQVTEEIHSFKGKRNLNVVPIYGGQSMTLQLRRLKKGADIIVGTPGRVLDHLKRKTLDLAHVRYLILDEADEMLSMGFLEDVTEIIQKTPQDKKTLLFSATMPSAIKNIAKTYMREYEFLQVAQQQMTASQTDQIYFEVQMADKFEALCRIIDIEEGFYGLVFCRTKVDVDNVATHLTERGYDAEALHGDISQNLREKILNKFKKGTVNILVATDVAARGIDVQDLSHVINYALPQDSESYVHRIGRTGRAGKEGIAITFITPSEYRRLQVIQRKVKSEIRKGTLPSVKTIIQMKRQRIQEHLREMLQEPAEEPFMAMAGEILRESSPEEAVAALLQFSFQEELSERSYRDIDRAIVDNKGKTRLFVHRGRKDGLTDKKLVQFITKRCSISPKLIRDVQILEKFSFVTLPFHEAEMVLSAFKQSPKGDALVVTKVKKERKSGGAGYQGRRK